MTDRQPLSAAAAAGVDTSTLRRDRLTVTLYSWFVTWGWFLYGFSPSVPLIATEQGISKAMAGLHGTAMAAGTVSAGLVSAVLVRRWGRRTVMLCGGATMVVGVGVLMAGRVLPVTLAAVYLATVGGTLVISSAQPALSVHHGGAGPAAVTEANAVGGVFGLLSPLCVGLTVSLGWGWRPAVSLSVALAVVTALLVLRLPDAGALSGRRTTHPVADGLPQAPQRGFTAAFWLFWCALIAGGALEGAMTFWAPEVMTARTTASAALATAAISALVAGMCLCRFIVGPLSLTKAPEKLLMLAFAVTGAGWAVFWTATSTPMALVGLFLSGLGMGAHYPLSVSLLMRASLGRPDQAQALATVGIGLASSVTPFALGALADGFGAHRAFLVVPVVIALGGVAVYAAWRSLHGALRRLATATPAGEA